MAKIPIMAAAFSAPSVFRIEHMITARTNIIAAGTQPIHREMKPPAIFPSIVIVAIVKTIVLDLSIPVVNTSPIYDLNITKAIISSRKKRVIGVMGFMGLIWLIWLIWLIGPIRLIVLYATQIATIIAESRPHEQATKPMASPIAPVETKMPRARMSFFV